MYVYIDSALWADTIENTNVNQFRDNMWYQTAPFEV